MILHYYWETVLGSKVKVKVLRTLCRFPTKRFTVRELAKQMGVSHTPVLKSLADLQGMNLITLEKHGTANLLTLNSKSHLYPLLKQLFSFEQETKANLEQRIKTILPPVEMAALFGSVQQGGEKMNSDIDLLIVSKNKKEVEESITNSRKTIIEEFGNLLSPLIFTVEEFKRKRNKPFAKDLIHHYKILKGQDLIQKWWKHD